MRESDGSPASRLDFRPERAKVFRAVVVGGSAGAAEALEAILSALPADFSLPIVVVRHLHVGDGGSFARYLSGTTRLTVIEPCDKERIESGCVYVAPADYHTLVERDGTISLSVDEKVNWSRPSIDVLFESAAGVWAESVIAVILSGASVDGAEGISAIRNNGGLTIAQDPASARTPFMPRAAIDTGAVDEVLPAEDIGRRLAELARCERETQVNEGEVHEQ